MNLESYAYLKKKFSLITIPEEKTYQYHHDESIFLIVPKIVLKPSSSAELTQIITVVSELRDRDTDISVTLRAAGTGLSGGSLNDSVIIDIMNLDSLREIDLNSEKPFITVEPGMFYRDFEKYFKDSSLTMPIFPSSREWCAIGGMIANNAAGENTLKYGAQDSFVDSLEIILDDGNTYQVGPVNFEKYNEIISQENRLSEIYSKLYELVKDSWSLISENPIKSSKNVSGYPLWKLLRSNPTDFENGEGTFDITKVIIGSQGTLGLITQVRYRLVKKAQVSNLLVIPVNDLSNLSSLVQQILLYRPEKLELFDKRTLSLAQEFPEDFKDSFFSENYDDFLASFQNDIIPKISTYNPKMVILAQLSSEDLAICNHDIEKLAGELTGSLLVTDPLEQEIYWAIRYSSLALVARHSKREKPAAFLEDLVIPLHNFANFYVELNNIIDEEKLKCAIHGHAGDVHLHFYPLLDFTQKNIAHRIKYLSEKFFTLAQKYQGSISGEHNDGIIRTPYLYLIYSPEWIELFEKTKLIFDPRNIFNPGKKVFPKFKITDSVRSDNNLGFFKTK
jgi:FAD/FMN-containing dehydrogenase